MFTIMIPTEVRMLKPQTPVADIAAGSFITLNAIAGRGYEAVSGAQKFIYVLTDCNCRLMFVLTSPVARSRSVLETALPRRTLRLKVYHALVHMMDRATSTGTDTSISPCVISATSPHFCACVYYCVGYV